MGKAGEALRQTLEKYGISQNQLATVLEVTRPTVFRWFHSQVDPTAETVVTIVEALRGLEPSAADEFIQLYLGDPVNEQGFGSHLTPVRRLPESDQVNVAALSGLFSDKTTSYKYLFFLSLLDILEEKSFGVLSPISFQEIIVEMLLNAWYPHTYFKLSFGQTDKITKNLELLDLAIDEPILNRKVADKKLLRKAIFAQKNLRRIVSNLSGYVPFRLIIPFLEEDLKGVDRSRGRDLEYAMPAIAEAKFEIKKPLYKFNSKNYKKCDQIILHPSWVSYLEKHYSIVRGWASWKWLIYMQSKNPNTPGIVNKIFIPQRRDPSPQAKHYWQRVIEVTPVRCIYSKEVLVTANIEIDHYLPWSFVAHDQIWNLVPVIPSANSSKSNKLPSLIYFDDFVLTQHLGLIKTLDRLGEKRWEKIIEPYLVDLRVTPHNLLDKEKLRRAYELVILPQISLAENQGFSTNWTYSPAQTG
jgi:transcriptional regulator with XRE-family HTH domain